jgi:hypothetical protein
MFNVYYAVIVVLYILLCFVEFIVFNEEILLALCFFSFIFFSFNMFSDSLFSSLTARASKFESDFLVSFATKKTLTVQNFQAFMVARGFQTKFQILLVSTLVYLTFSKQYLFLKKSSAIYTKCFSKFSEFFLITQKLLGAFQKNCVALVLYPLIFSSTKTAFIMPTVSSSSFTVSSLKLLSI